MTSGAKGLTPRATTEPRATTVARERSRGRESRSEPTFAARDVGAMVDGLQRLGYDVAALLRDAGLSRDALANPDGLITCVACGTLFGIAQRQRPAANFFLRLAERIPLGAFPLLDYLVVSSDTVGEGLRQLARYFRLSGNHTHLDIRDTETPVRIVVHGVTHEFTLALMALHMRSETDGAFRPLSIHISQPVDDAADYARVLGCRVIAPDAWSGLSIAPETWRLPLRRRDPVLRGVLERHASDVLASHAVDDDLQMQVMRALSSGAPGERVSVEGVARQLATSPRTLQRRLAGIGVSFQSLVERSRRERAERYLGSDQLSVGEVGYLLGYSEPAAFHRAFRRWTGMTPAVYRSSSGARVRSASVRGTR